jgi:tripeptide aminopeptidase
MNALVDLFLQLVNIPSPSGQELKVEKFIKNYLKQKNISAEFDDTGKLNDSNCGNLISKISGDPKLPTLLFVSHADTVETGEKIIKPIVENDVIKSDGTTILGADNKVSDACMMQVLEEVSKWRQRPTVIVAFTTREEKGKMGTSVLELSEKIDYCFNLDGPNSLGDFVNQTLGEMPFEIKIHGKAAHAAVEPEKGINAIKAAALLITKLPIGKDKQGAVLNIGTISGGRANNIVPDEVVLSGQIRAFEQHDLEKLINDAEDITKDVCTATGCSYEFIQKYEEGVPVYHLDEKHKIVDFAKKATAVLNLPFSLIKGSYTADSNFLSIKYPTLTICRGSKMPHSFEESVSIADMSGLKNLIIEIIKQTMI